MDKKLLYLGETLSEDLKNTGKKFELPVKGLERHLGIFGSTGSGKTVLGKAIIEELTIAGVPSILVDPQGDLASLALFLTKEEMKKYNVNEERALEFRKKADVRIYTPASTKGIPISINPVELPSKNMDREDAIRIMDSSAKLLGKLLVKVANFPPSMESEAVATLYALLEYAWNNDIKIEGIQDLIDLMTEKATDDLIRLLNKYMDTNRRERLRRALLSMTVGVGELLFETGKRLDIENLLKAKKGKVPVNIFFLKTLPTDEERDLFLAVLFNELYSWMIRQGSTKGLRLVVFIDEVAPYIPAGTAKPGPKGALLLLLRQARKYGISIILATQSPRDVDYHAFDQVNSYVIGRITSKQSLETVRRAVEAGAGESKVAKIMDIVPRLMPGTFVVISQKLKRGYGFLRTRWLYTLHETLTEEELKTRIQKRIAELMVEEEREKKKKEKKKKIAKEKKKPAPHEVVSGLDKPVSEDETIEFWIKKIKEEKSKAETEQQRRFHDNMHKLLLAARPIVRTWFGVNLLKELIEKRELEFMKAAYMYYNEVEAVLATRIGKKEKRKINGKEKEMLVYDFAGFFKNAKCTGDPEEVRKTFETIVKRLQLRQKIKEEEKKKKKKKKGWFW